MLNVIMLSVIIMNVIYKPFMLSVIMLCVIMLNVVCKPFMLNVVYKPFMLSVIMLSVIMLNVVALAAGKEGWTKLDLCIARKRLNWFPGLSS